jgi:hypothetical protein
VKICCFFGFCFHIFLKCGCNMLKTRVFFFNLLGMLPSADIVDSVELGVFL